MSDFYLQKGDYFRLKLIQLGYTLPVELTKNWVEINSDSTLLQKIYLLLLNIPVTIRK